MSCDTIRYRELEKVVTNFAIEMSVLVSPGTQILSPKVSDLFLRILYIITYFSYAQYDVGEDLYAQLKSLQRHVEFLDIQV